MSGTGVGTRAAPSRTRTTAASGGLRTDIQGLRAVAVAAVLVYHLWPAGLTGGYVGVDVFFVVSGFLITSHLLRRPPTTRAGFGRFWGRRVRRLLPASALVVVVTVVAALAWLPASRLERTAVEAVASALYVQNWALAAAATDYLAAAAEPTPFLHYWSLAIEEQFYLVWPLLIGGAVLAGRRWWPARDPLRAVAVAVGAVLVTSLAWSVWLTATDPAPAYLVTPTRMWELALGGAVALWATSRRRAADDSPASPARPIPGAGQGAESPVRAVAAWLGLAMIAVAATTFDEATPFPGVAALLPTAGTALVIAATSTGRRGPGRLLAWRPAQVLGDVSYSTYLWHWPLVVIVPFALGVEPAWYHLAGIGAASVGLAWLTTRYVEDPVRTSRRLASPRATVAVLVLCTGAGSLAGLGLRAWVDHTARRDAAVVEQAAAEHADCFGAAAVLGDADCAEVADRLWTSPAFAQADRPAVYPDGCWNNAPFSSRRTCGYGVPAEEATVSVALLGNSHAGHWSPALTALAEQRGWSLTTYLTSVCYPVDLPLDFAEAGVGEGCAAWTDWALQQVTTGYDLVVLASRTDQPLAGVPRAEQDAVAREAYGRLLDRLTAAGVDVLVLRDTFNAGEPVPDCVAAAGGDASACSWPVTSAIEVDPLAEAAAERAGVGEGGAIGEGAGSAAGEGGDPADRTGTVALADPTDLLCDADRCLSVVGGVIVFFDHGHLTATFARTTTPWLTTEVDAALGR